MNIYAFSSLLNIIGSISIGLFILTRYKRDTRYVTFGLFCLVSFIWSFYYFLWQMTTNERLALLYCRNMMIGAIFIPIFYLHHVLSLLGQAQRKKLILHIGYILSFIFLLFDFTPYFISNLTPKLVFKFHPNPGPVYSYYMVYWISCVLYALYLLIDGLRSSTGLLHKQIKYMLIAALIAWGGGATNYPLWYDIPMLPIGNLLVFLYVPTAAYAMIKHKLMDIEIVMARSFILICIYIPIILFAFAIKAWGDHILYPIFGDKWIFVPFTAVAVLSFAGSFSYLYFQQKIDTRRIKRQYAQLIHLKDITRKALEINWEELLANIPAFLCQMYRKEFNNDIDYAAIYFYDKKTEEYILFSHKARRPNSSLPQRVQKNHPFPTWFYYSVVEEAKPDYAGPRLSEYIQYEDVGYYQDSRKDVAGLDLLGRARDEMEKLGSDACVPCFYLDKLLAFLVLGKKQRGSYSEEEMNTFAFLNHDVAIAIRNGEQQDEIIHTHLDALAAVSAALEERDTYTRGHSERVAQFGEEIAKELVAMNVIPFAKIYNLPEKTRLTGLLHDLGKIGLLDKILFKKGKLTKQEYEQIKRHPSASIHIIDSLKSIPQETRDGIENHHEKYDGTGYNKGLWSQRIPPIARIISVADAFDAMTSERRYHKMRTAEEAWREINRMAGTQFDPQVVTAFNRAYEKKHVF